MKYQKLDNKKFNIWIRTIILILTITFSFQSILWANPEILQRNTILTNLQVQSKFNPANPELLHKGLIELPLKYIVESTDIEKFKHPMTLPVYEGINLVLNFSEKQKEGNNYIIPCSIADVKKGYRWKYNAVVDENKSISLIKPHIKDEPTATQKTVSSLKSLIIEIWPPKDEYLATEAKIEGETYLTVQGDNFIVAGDFLFISREEWEKHRVKLQNYKNNIIICKVIQGNDGYATFERNNNGRQLAILLLQAGSKYIKNKIFLDAGSGKDAILATVISRLEAKKVFAIDKNTEFVNESRQFLALNGVNNVEVIEKDFADIDEISEIKDVDGIAANISVYEEANEDSAYLDMNWHQYLADKLRPSAYFLCGIYTGAAHPENVEFRMNINGWKTGMKATKDNSIAFLMLKNYDLPIAKHKFRPGFATLSVSANKEKLFEEVPEQTLLELNPLFVRRDAKLVGRLARLIGQEAGLSSRLQNFLYKAGLVHDVGKGHPLISRYFKSDLRPPRWVNKLLALLHAKFTIYILKKKGIRLKRWQEKVLHHHSYDTTKWNLEETEARRCWTILILADHIVARHSPRIHREYQPITYNTDKMLGWLRGYFDRMQGIYGKGQGVLPDADRELIDIVERLSQTQGFTNLIYECIYGPENNWSKQVDYLSDEEETGRFKKNISENPALLAEIQQFFGSYPKFIYALVDPASFVSRHKSDGTLLAELSYFLSRLLSDPTVLGDIPVCEYPRTRAQTEKLLELSAIYNGNLKRILSNPKLYKKMRADNLAELAAEYGVDKLFLHYLNIRYSGYTILGTNSGLMYTREGKYRTARGFFEEGIYLFARKVFLGESPYVYSSETGTLYYYGQGLPYKFYSIQVTEGLVRKEDTESKHWYFKTQIGSKMGEVDYSYLTINFHDFCTNMCPFCWRAYKEKLKCFGRETMQRENITVDQGLKEIEDAYGPGIFAKIERISIVEGGFSSEDEELAYLEELITKLKAKGFKGKIYVFTSFVKSLRRFEKLKSLGYSMEEYAFPLESFTKREQVLGGKKKSGFEEAMTTMISAKKYYSHVRAFLLLGLSDNLADLKHYLPIMARNGLGIQLGTYFVELPRQYPLLCEDVRRNEINNGHLRFYLEAAILAHRFGWVRPELDRHNQIWSPTVDKYIHENSILRVKKGVQANPQNLYLRDFPDLEQLANHFVAALISVSVTKKVVLAFDNNIRNPKSLGFIKLLDRLKKNEVFGRLLKNVIIVTEKPEDLPHKIREYIDIDNNMRVFMFAPLKDMEKLEDITREANVQSVFIDDSNFPLDFYYPLVDIVTITLLEYNMPGIIDNISDIFNSLKIDFALLNVDIKSIRRNAKGALIFYLLPNIKEYNPDERVSRYVRLQRFLKSA